VYFAGRRGVNEFTNDIWVVDLSGGEPRNLTQSPGMADVTPAVTRNGETLAFTSEGPPLGLYRMSVDGTGRTALETTDELDWYPAWSPDGTQIAFESNTRGGDHEIWVMNADGSGARLVVAPGRWPTWSPDGRQLAYEGDNCQIWVVAADGSNPHPFRPGDCTSDTLQYQPAWSPDGRRIATSSDVPLLPFAARARRIITMEINGTGPRTLSDGPSDAAPAWSPDGRLVVFVHGGNPAEGLSLIMVPHSGLDARTITSGWDLLERPAW
jgi:Tol biopolymer transport system component